MKAAIHLYERANWTRGSDPPPGSGADHTYDLTDPLARAGVVEK
jgi:hypothetical protein